MRSERWWTCVSSCVLFALVPAAATAQSITDPSTLQFTASSAHDATLSDGTPVVQYYRLDLYLDGATAPFQTVNLGKPTPDSTNTITLDMSTVFTGWPLPGTTYVSDVAAVGPTGSGVSAPSNTFTFTTQCSATVTPVSQTAASGGGTASETVSATTGCSWIAMSDVNWVTISSGATGSGSGTVAYSVSPNTTGVDRAGTLQVAGQSVTVAQAGSCSFNVSPTSQAEPAAGGSATVSVSTTSGCAWTAASNASWITVTSGTAGTASGTVAYTVAANTTTSARTATLNVAGQAVTVTQAGSCGYTISPTTQSEPAGGGAASVTVTTTSGCSWIATSNVGWITVTSGASGSGNGTVGYTVAANTTTTTRSGTLSVAGQTLTVTQDAGAASPTACTYGVSPTSVRFNLGGGTATVNVTTAGGCPWTATTATAWITITSGASGSGSGTVTFAAAPNKTPQNGSLVVAGTVVDVRERKR